MSSKVIHLIFKCCSSYGSTCLENAKLLLVEYLRVSKALIANLAEVLTSHDLLAHHQVICLGTVNSFLALDISYAVLRIILNVAAAHSAYRTNTSRHILLAKLLYSPWPIRILGRDLWTIALEPHHTPTDAHNSILFS